METKTILDFIHQLKENNNREWFEANRKMYQKSKKEFEALLAELIKGLSELDPQLEGLKPKDCTFRINRDIRFSKDKRPYKTNFGGVIARGGKKSHHALFYIHLEPGNCFLAGGVYMPANEYLNMVRQEIDYNPEEFRSIINDAAFKKYFGGLEGEKLKRAPKGYSPDNPNIDLINFKSYLAMHNVSDQLVTSEKLVPYALEIYRAMMPMYNFINRSFD